MRLPSLLTASAASLLVPIVAGAMGVQVIIDGQTVTFIDVAQNAWFADYVHDAAEANIVNGYKDARGHLTGKFGPQNSITIAEALKVAIEGSGYNPALYGALIDSGLKNHWASIYVAVGKAENFAVLPDRIRLDRPATRSEVAALFASAFGLDLTNVSPVDSRFTDVKSTTRFAAAIEALSRDGVVSGDTDLHGQAIGTFRPLDPIIRAEVVKMIMLARAQYGEPGKDKKPEEQTQSDTNVVTYTNDGFTPAVLHVKQGDMVTFRNDSDEPMWIASNPHPTHTAYSGFDALKGIATGQQYSFTFTRIGTVGYHNHLHASMLGTIVVDQ